MPMSPLKACSNCGKATPASRCPECESKARQIHDKQSADRRKRYPARYDHFRDALKNCGNVFCQFVAPGTRIRCANLAEILHHLLAADDYPQFLVEYRNAVRVCREHHPITKGDPGGIEYIPTTWPQSLGGPPAVEVMPGERVPGDIELWTLATQRRKLLGR